MKVAKLKRILEQHLNLLNCYDDEDEVKMVSNTYFLQGAPIFLGISGIDGGYVDLDNPVDEQEED